MRCQILYQEIDSYGLLWESTLEIAFIRDTLSCDDNCIIFIDSLIMKTVI